MTLHELIGASTAINAALRSGLLAAVMEGRAAADVLATKSKSDPRTARLVLDVLVAFGIVDREGDTYGPSAALVQAMEVAPLGIHGVARVFGHTEEMLATGRPIAVMNEAREREATYRNVVDVLAKLSEAQARVLAGSLERAPARILDIGCGSGVWSLAMAERFPDAHVTGLDLPDVVRRFEARAQALGLSGRTHAIGADVHEGRAVPPASFDLVVVANVLRIEDEARARAIVARAAEASSSRVVVVDALAEGTPARERARAVYTLHLALRSRDGNVYSRERISSWFGEHGLRLAAVVDFEESSPAAALVFDRA
jgi:SAM-dependent methyltransferase